MDAMEVAEEMDTGGDGGAEAGAAASKAKAGADEEAKAEALKVEKAAAERRKAEAAKVPPRCKVRLVRRLVALLQHAKVRERAVGALGQVGHGEP